MLERIQVEVARGLQVRLAAEVLLETKPQVAARLAGIPGIPGEQADEHAQQHGRRADDGPSLPARPRQARRRTWSSRLSETLAHLVRDVDERGVIGCAAPVEQVERMDLAEAERRHDRLDAYWQQLAGLESAHRFIANEARASRRLRPQHDDDMRLGDLLLDDFGELGTASQVAIPPDIDAERAERVRDPLCRVAILARVTDEELSQRSRSRLKRRATMAREDVFAPSR